MNRWNVLSIHWDVDNVSSRDITDKSETWCNGVKLKSFTSRSSTGSNQMTFGDLNPSGIAPFDGDIAFFGLYKGFHITDDLIQLHHNVLMA